MTFAWPTVLAAFLASLVEFVEALTIVLAVGAVRGWRSAWVGTVAAAGLLAVLIVVFGPGLSHFDVPLFQIIVGTLLMLFGLRWLRKAILRAAGVVALHDEANIYARETAALSQGPGHNERKGLDTGAVLTAFNGVFIEGVEVVFIVLAVGAAGHRLLPAALGAAAAAVIVVLLGIVARRPLSQVPENALKLIVGVLLSAFGTFWTGEGLGLIWPGGDWATIALSLAYGLVAALGVALTRSAALSLLLLAVLLCPGVAADPAAAQKAWMLGPFVKADGVNPILKPDADALFAGPLAGKPVAWERDNVFNPAAVVRDGRVDLLYRAEDDSGAGIGHHTSRIGLAESRDGLHFAARPTPVLFPSEDAEKQYEWPGGCEDPRCVETPGGGYLVLYTEWNGDKARLASATSRDLVHWDKHGPVFAQADGGRFLDLWCKSGAVLTEQRGDHLVAMRLHGRYWMYWGDGPVRAATSTDLVHWEPVLDKGGDPLPLLSARAGKFDSALCEAGPPAVWRRDGIVLIYNGMNAGSGGDPSLRADTYCAGQALFAPDDPTRLLDRTDAPFLTPERPYEASGQYAAGTVFCEGLVRFRRRWLLYYGTADSLVAVAASEK